MQRSKHTGKRPSPGPAKKSLKKRLILLVLCFVLVSSFGFTQLRPVTWSDPITIEISPKRIHDPDVTLLSNDWAIGAWCQSQNESGANGIYSSTCVGQLWTTPVCIDTGTSDYQTVRIASDKNERIMAVWLVNNQGEGSSIYASTRKVHEPWDAPVHIVESNTFIKKDNFNFVMNAKGQAALIYSDRESTVKAHIYRRESPFKWTWSEATILAERGIRPKVTMDDKSNILAVWYTGDGQLASRACNASGEWGSMVTTATGSADFQFALNSKGNAMALWTYMGAEYDLCLQASRWDGETWSSPETVVSGLFRNGMPDVTLDWTGKANVAFYAIDYENNARVLTCTYKRETGWSTPKELQPDAHRFPRLSSDSSIPPRIVFNKIGNPTIVWNDFGERSIYANQWLPLAGFWGGPLKISGEGTVFWSSGGLAGSQKRSDKMMVWAEIKPNGSALKAVIRQ